MLRRSQVIRALIATSVILLVVGAVTPLLTTERFYFFSNTFSLISGLRQLVENDQVLIALVITLFSLCVPVVKAVVIWIAATPNTARSRWLVIADRFGKWSMLEVFIAALLIVSLKLGPVVDATLHYGAWLLAASVLLAGIASQLLTHEPHSGPLFSSSVTLTIGAIGGAIAATLLIGLLNPGLFNLEALVGTPESRCVQRTLRMDRLFAAASASESDYVLNLQSIETESCPEDFSDAFADYVDAFASLSELDPEQEEEPSLLDRAVALVGLATTRDDVLEEIEEARAELERIALEHGVTAPDR